MLLLVAAAAASSAALSTSHDPSADPRALVIAGDVRFTVLTPQLIRMEWAADRRFEDAPSLAMLNRRLPVPRFTRNEENGWLEIETAKLTLRYRMGSGKFTPENLRVSFTLGGTPVEWRPGMQDTANLRGTRRTLDGVKGATSLEPGLLSRDGWVVVDDSERPLFDDSQWPWVMTRLPGERQDLYFFGYGRDYKRALYDFTTVAGKIPMPPRFAFGLWWSRYWGYTDEEFKRLVGEFETHGVPLEVLVIDMDWHLTFNQRWDREVKDQAGQTLGWTGYTWDRNFFPDPAGFLSWCERRGLRTPLNLHPASGIQPHEEHYPEMARSMGIDPATKMYVPFDIVDKKFATNYLKHIIRPLEDQGVDFWWLDWQQWGTTKVPGVTPTWWLNYVFFTDMERKDRTRPILFHRWGGLGNHRYQIGFSGDTYSVWESLAFQPYFTATAANVGFGYWSHDIGGHMPGEISPELFTRWIQYGTFSPIVRTHTTKNPAAERRIWAYPTEYFLIMREAILLRYGLIPYLYTESRKAYETGVSICRPMYYEYPDAPEAYAFTGQYFFGDNMIVAPVAAPVDTASMLAVQKVWLPPGTWIEYFTGSVLKGPAVLERQFALEEIPLYVRSGSIIPMQRPAKSSIARPMDPCVLSVFPGDTGSYALYEDAGNSLGYQRGEFATTMMRQSWTPDGQMKIRIDPARGSYPGMPRECRYEIRLECSWPPASVAINGKPVGRVADEGETGWRYDGDATAVVITTPRQKSRAAIEVTVRFPAGTGAERPDGVRGMIARLKRVMPVMNGFWPAEWSPEVLVNGSQTGNRMGLDPAKAREEAAMMRAALPGVRAAVDSSRVSAGAKAKVLKHLEGLR
jgi:alpha-glucosidase